MKRDLFKRVVKSVVMIEAGASGGTGFFARSDGVILTAAHVVADEPHVLVTTYEGVRRVARVLSRDIEDDIAAIGWDVGPDSEHCVLSTDPESSVAVGDEVFTIGHPASSAPYSLTRGVVSALRHRVAHQVLPVIQLNLSINPDNSGGPVFAADGSFVGLITSFPYDEENRIEGIAWATIPAMVSELLATVPEKEPRTPSPEDVAVRKAFRAIPDINGFYRVAGLSGTMLSAASSNYLHLNDYEQLLGLYDYTTVRRDGRVGFALTTRRIHHYGGRFDTPKAVSYVEMHAPLQIDSPGIQYGPDHQHICMSADAAAPILAFLTKAIAAYKGQGLGGQRVFCSRCGVWSRGPFITGLAYNCTGCSALLDLSHRFEKGVCKTCETAGRLHRRNIEIPDDAPSLLNLDSSLRSRSPT